MSIKELMYDFSCTNPDDMNYETLAKKARYFKQNKEGVAAMCKIMEDMRKEAAKEAALDSAKQTAEIMIRDREMSLEKIAHYVPLLSMDDLKEIEERVLQLT